MLGPRTQKETLCPDLYEAGSTNVECQALSSQVRNSVTEGGKRSEGGALQGVPALRF